MPGGQRTTDSLQKTTKGKNMNLNPATELRHISNEITDLAIAGATSEELTPLIERSMELMDEMRAQKS
jgi:hypothetical protein